MTEIIHNITQHFVLVDRFILHDNPEQNSRLLKFLLQCFFKWKIKINESYFSQNKVFIILFL